MHLTRRDLFAGAAGTAALNIALDARPARAADAQRDVLVVIFQRGAADWLQMLSPSGDADYQKARPSIKTTANGSLGLGTMNGTDLYIAQNAPELKALYDAGSLAFVAATGMYTNDRSHFTCQDKMERGAVDGEPSQLTGWLTRHMNSIRSTQALPILSTLSSSSSVPVSLLGNTQALAVGNSQAFNVSGGTANAQLIRSLSAGTSKYEASARETLDAVASLQIGLQTINTAASNSAGYTGGALSTALRSLAQIIRMKVGLTTATVDFGSWDMHNNLVNEFATRTTEFSRAIAAFWRDMADYQANLTIVTMTEFGRRFQENANQGTDHGAASGMLVLGGGVNGGKLYGTWPGLGAKQLVNGGDLAVTTDYRQVLAEIITTRHGETQLGTVFPTIKYSPLGLTRQAQPAASF